MSEIGPIYGSEVTFDEASAMTGAIGLLFCPYIEVVPPGTTNNFGVEPVPDEFSLTFTNQNIAVDDGGGFPPPAGDAKTVAIAIAQHVLG